MSVSRHSATRQVPLAHVAHLAGETFGHQQAHDSGLSDNVYSSRAVAALALSAIVCLLAAAYLAI